MIIKSTSIVSSKAYYIPRQAVSNGAEYFRGQGY